MITSGLRPDTPLRAAPSWSMAKGLVGVGLAVLGLVASSCRSPPPPESEGAAIPAVAVATVTEQRWSETIELTVELVPWAVVTVAAETSGRVVALPVDHGDRVVAGDPVARLDPASAEADVAQARARLQSARSSLEQARRDRDRGLSLAGRDGIISDDELERLALALDTAQANLDEAAAAVTVATERLVDMVVRAPFDGVVSKRQAEIGSWLVPGNAVVRLVDDRRLKARAAASQPDRMRLQPGTMVTVQADALPEQSFEGTIRYLGQEADPVTGTYLVEAEVPVPSMAEGAPRLLAGLQGAMRIELSTRETVLIPRSAVLSTRTGDAVFVVVEGTARRREVEVVRLDPETVEVVSGITRGEELVVQGQHGLTDGLAVEVRAP